MRNKYILFIIAGLLFAGSIKAQQFKKLDTIAKLGDAGYHVSCSNKNPNANPLNVSPIGFKSEARPAYFQVNGRVSSIAVDDFNDDGFPDLLIFYFTGTNNEIGNIVCISSTENTSIVPVGFPDIYNDPKLRPGYKGHDEFKVMVGTLLRTYPIYKDGDTDTPTGGKRVVQYKMGIGEGGRPVFKVIRTYEKQD